MDEEEYRKKLLEVQKQRELELQKREIIRSRVDAGAYERLSNIRSANPELYEKLTTLIVYLVQNGQLKTVLTEDQLKQLISRLVVSQRKETKIIRK
ncbi:MAG: DNA-binding protein [Candidatus Micrarchaeota archaeon]